MIRDVHLSAGLDLALFDQAVWHYRRFEASFDSLNRAPQTAPPSPERPEQPRPIRTTSTSPTGCSAS